MSTEADESHAWMPWDLSYELGIPVVDEQHKHLVYLCNKFRDKLTNRNVGEGASWQNALSDALRETVQYTKTHFSTEEKLMQASAYPNYDYHKRCHHEFIETITYILGSFNLATLETAYEFSAYLKEWILTHIAYEDRQFQSHIIEYCKNRSVQV